jgi:aminomethyltransferase
METKITALFDVHQKLGAKMVPFAGYYMPIQYRGIMEEHRRVRATVGLFDVSHMGEFVFKGRGALDFLQQLTTNDVAKLDVNQAQYTVMCTEDGGIIDDLIVYRLADHYLMVVNAANIEKDWQWIHKYQPDEVELTNVTDETTLLALQGPKAEATLQKIVNVDLSDIQFYHLIPGKLDETPVIISRTGYTGEPGFELFFDKHQSEDIWNLIMSAGQEFDIEPIGLGARDTLRLEMKYCLYGNDIDETTTPLEAGLGWITKLDKGDFIGREALLKVKEQGIRRKLVGFQVEGKAFPRNGYDIYADHQKIGRVTSGTVSPILNRGIGMGYVQKPYTKIGTPIRIEIRQNHIPGLVVGTPFYKK